MKKVVVIGAIVVSLAGVAKYVVDKKKARN